MTTIKDYGYESRQKLIATTFDLSTQKGRQDAYQFWIARGHSESAATNASGYHPIDEFDTWFGKLTMFLVVGMVAILLFILANSAYAVTMGRADLKDAQSSESALVACLNGGEMVLSDGSRWQCIKVGMEK